MNDGELLLLAEAAECNAADCGRSAREAREKRKAAFAQSDLAGFEKWAKIAREWGNQARRPDLDAAITGIGATSRRWASGGATPMGK